ncbi:HAMP domain-containing sensor histidine kinase [Pseudomonas sp. TTU2014-080ASC]|uniref:HAMP domain-containing sensor histidine kinase n=1 Tax=Pseudomonas sp. TTU2014-080ASC TaxID=1729724 RepID=UPI000718A14F|nr:sensor histidine kinase [Pseudomonas sp. TTU2014-080ASC]KRW59645.1 histidine kinase [Pseudomonas sp. TTU2014-080ASC]
MTLPSRHSLLWKLVAVLSLFCVLLISLNVDLFTRLHEANARLDQEARQELLSWRDEAQQAWFDGGRSGVDAFLIRLWDREQVWAAVLDSQFHSYSSRALSEEERRRLNYARNLDGMFGRPGSRPSFLVPLQGLDGYLAIELPQRLDPRRNMPMWELILHRIVPIVLALLVGLLLYRILIGPLRILHHQANALSAGNLSARAGAQATARRDELGGLARAFNQMAGRLESTVKYQRQLLHDLSHELRTPLSRLRVAAESERDVEAMRQRLELEVEGMEKLVADTLEFVWMGDEQLKLPLEAVNVSHLWGVVRENASFETGWPLEQMPCHLPEDCQVLGHLNGLAQALENILRNAIRYSPEGGVVGLSGQREGDYWLLSIEDQGPGVHPDKLDQIFEPFIRLSAARPGGDGFGLGLSIARRMVERQGGFLWAENGDKGLRLRFKLKVYSL